jgi:hypothetical protein
MVIGFIGAGSFLSRLSFFISNSITIFTSVSKPHKPILKIKVLQTNLSSNDGKCLLLSDEAKIIPDLHSSSTDI